MRERRLIVFCVSINAEFQKSERPDLRPASLDDEVYTPSSRRSEGRRDQLGDRCPSRAASKTSMPTLNGQRNLQIFIRPLILTLPAKIRSKIFQIVWLFIPPAAAPNPPARRFN
jgi:hypothetical protein